MRKRKMRWAVAAALLLLSASGGGLAPYPDLAGAYGELRAFAEAHPGKVELMVGGKSAGGRDLMVVRVHAGDGKARPAALIAGNIHGDEYIGNRAATAAISLLLKEDDALAAEALEHFDVYVIPVMNPDGYEATWASNGEGPPAKTRRNADGVDLNRNFGKPQGIPLPLGYSGSTKPESTRYTGPEPVSEPESKMVMALARDKRFFAAIDFHASGGIIIPALADDAFTQRGLRRMANTYRANQAMPYIIQMFPYVLPIYQGSMEEGMLREAGTLAVLIELGKSGDMKGGRKKDNYFWDFNPSDPKIIALVSLDNARAAIAALIEGFKYTGGKTEPKPVKVK